MPTTHERRLGLHLLDTRRPKASPKLAIHLAVASEFAAKGIASEIQRPRKAELQALPTFAPPSFSGFEKGLLLAAIRAHSRYSAIPFRLSAGPRAGREGCHHYAAALPMSWKTHLSNPCRGRLPGRANESMEAARRYPHIQRCCWTLRIAPVRIHKASLPAQSGKTLHLLGGLRDQVGALFAAGRFQKFSKNLAAAYQVGFAVCCSLWRTGDLRPPNLPRALRRHLREGNQKHVPASCS